MLVHPLRTGFTAVDNVFPLKLLTRVCTAALLRLIVSEGRLSVAICHCFLETLESTCATCGSGAAFGNALESPRRSRGLSFDDVERLPKVLFP